MLACGTQDSVSNDNYGVRLMERRRLRRLVGTAMVGLGHLQVALGAVQDDLFFAGYGLVYTALGGAYLHFEGGVAQR